MPLRSNAWLDNYLGMKYYITDCPGIDGKVKSSAEDFIVEEVLLDGTVIPTTVTGKPMPNITGRPGPWTWLIVEKRNVDPISLALIIRFKLHVREDDVSFAGLKDTVAVTSQVVSVRGVRPEDVPRELGRDVKVLAGFSMDRPITTRDIWGNEFTVRIRNVTGDLGAVDCVVNQLNALGLPAYYGYQRFGVRRPNSHVIGRFIVHGDFEGAINELLTHPYPLEPPRIRELREFIARTHDYAKALELMPKGVRYYPERVVLRHLASNPRDYVNALRKLPTELLRLFVESYQSYLFNLALSIRIERGLPLNEALDGDSVVLLDEHGLPTRHVINVNESMRDRVNQLIARGRAAVIGHLLGYGVRIYPGSQGDAELKVMKEEGVEPGMFRIRQIPRASVRGGFRPLSVKPLIINYSVGNGTLTINFRLPRGNYATVLLREFMKSKNPELALG
ncbi:tRNA pseudouridine(13) synthase TruD [Vulcanisaeta thermophila]|uniref:tRNA pseudouridine(13) synthase TruD n=1 Tax=Vulcanisaeta thermophila TaxID=867917 RepID=UPI000853C9B1|nr:tRNA pseudouridine(13) synthase TruD [Vulcanisaeta thermophila]